MGVDAVHGWPLKPRGLETGRRVALAFVPCGRDLQDNLLKALPPKLGKLQALTEL